MDGYRHYVTKSRGKIKMVILYIIKEKLIGGYEYVSINIDKRKFSRFYDLLADEVGELRG